MTTTMTSRAFNQDAGAAKKAAAGGPVIITDRGRPAHVLMTFDDYRRLTGEAPSLVDLLAQPDAAAIGFEPPRLDFPLRPVDLA